MKDKEGYDFTQTTSNKMKTIGRVINDNIIVCKQKKHP
jgi:hypothetical protein